MKGTCAFCGRGVESRDTAAYRVRGWEIERAQGGANHIVEREREPNIVAHAMCVESRQRQRRYGIAYGQEPLV